MNDSCVASAHAGSVATARIWSVHCFGLCGGQGRRNRAASPDRSTSLRDRPMTWEKGTDDGAES